MSIRRMQKSLQKKTGHFIAVWEPGMTTDVGDIGVVRDYIFMRQSNIKRVAANFKVKATGIGPIVHQDYVSLDLQSSGQHSLAKADIRFQKDGGYVFSLRDRVLREPDDPSQLYTLFTQLLAKSPEKAKELVLVDMVYSSRDYTIITATSSGASISASARQIDLDFVNLGSAKIALSGGSKSITQYHNAPNATKRSPILARVMRPSPSGHIGGLPNLWDLIKDIRSGKVLAEKIRTTAFRYHNDQARLTLQEEGQAASYVVAFIPAEIESGITTTPPDGGGQTENTLGHQSRIESTIRSGYLQAKMHR